MSDVIDPDETFEQPFVDYSRANPRFGIRRPGFRPAFQRPRSVAKPYWLHTPDPEPKGVPIPRTSVLVSFGYDLFGDIALDDWTDRFDAAETAGWIDSHQVLLVQTGSFGLRHLTMTVHADIPAGEKIQVDADAHVLLATIIGEHDLQVYFVSQV